ncbi:squalene synthetase-like protein [Microsporum audouinii]
MPVRRHGKHRGSRRAHEKPPDVSGEEHQFTLSQEARNTERHFFQRSSRQLRYQTVQFVSGGQKEPDDPSVLRNLDNLALDQPGQPARPEDVDIDVDTVVEELHVTASREEPTDDLFSIDADGDKTTPKPTFPKPVINCDSSDSSEDEVVFKGRRPAWGYWSQHVSPIVINDPPATARAQDTHPRRSNQTGHHENPGYQGWTGVTEASAPRKVVLEFGNDSADSDAVADYIANIDQDDASSSSTDDEQPGRAATPKTPHMSGPDGVENIDSSDEGEDDDDDNDGSDLEEIIDEDMQWMSDEQLAHLLDNRDIPDMDADEIDFFTTNGFARSAATTSGLKKKKKNKKKSAQLQEPVSASKLADMFEADPHGAFDVMDRNRASVMGKKARGKIPDFNLSDSELESNIQASWEADRKKKKAKKLEREELRAQGLLGRFGKSQPQGNSPDDVRDEIRSFMMSRTQTLHLPPMTKKDRRIVHEIANALSLKSISRGKGNGRFPILTKTHGTPVFYPDETAKLDALVFRHRITRYSERRRTEAGARPAKSSGEAKAASYRDGDVVGAWAPEIGADNRGRVMLEKMGWNTGMSLGAANNKGILQPITHVVKTTKAGLG